MSDIETLIEDWGDVDEIPEEVLADAGYERDDDGNIVEIGEVFYVEEPDRAEFANGVTYSPDELVAKREQAGIERKELLDLGRERRSYLADLLSGPVGTCLSESTKDNLVSDLGGDYLNPSDVVSMSNPGSDLDPDEIKFLRITNDYLVRNPCPEHLRGAIDGIGKDFLEGDYWDLEEDMHDDKFTGALNKEYARIQLDFDTNLKTLGSIADDFEDKYGPVSFCGMGPFKSYAFKRSVLGEDEPSEFWGRKLFGLRAEFLEKYGNVKDAERLADFIYDDSVDVIGRRVFGNVDGKSLAIMGFEALGDNLPYPVEDFEENRKKLGVAKGLIETTSCYCIDDDYLKESKWLRDVLEDVHRVEFPELFEGRLGEGFSHLERAVKSGSKRQKLARLSNQFPEFDTHLKEVIGGNVNYVDGLEENLGTTVELERLGIDTDTFYNGIAPVKFVIESGKAVDEEEVKERFLSEYKASLDELLDGDVVHAPNRLEEKLTSVVDIPEGSDTREYLYGLEDESSLRKVCNTCVEYVSKKQNQKDAQASGATIHHLRSVGGFFGKKRKNGETESRYTVRIASKNPLTDVDIGNDAGCCIGVYDSSQGDDAWNNDCVDRFVDYLDNGAKTGLNEEVGENGCFMPFYLKDRATQFAEIYRGDERIGMGLMFAGKNERDESVLMVNSIEASDKLKRDPNYKHVVESTVEYLANYAEASGFKHASMSNHSYNPAKGYVSGELDFEKLEKVHHWEEGFYSDALYDGKGNNREWKRLETKVSGGRDE